MKIATLIIILALTACVPSAQELKDAFLPEDGTTEETDNTDVATEDTDTNDSNTDTIESGGTMESDDTYVDSTGLLEYVGRFKQSYIFDQCDNYPNILKMYLIDDDDSVVVFKTADGKDFVVAQVQPDESFEFKTNYTNKFDQWVRTDVCSCTYYVPYQNGDYFDCTCETTESQDGYGGSCDLEYDMQ